jgi:sigma-B regulation protein RsbU (phosphoserine phosphatase)
MTKSPPGSGSRSAPELLATLVEDVRLIAAEVQQRGIKRAVGGSFTSLEAFYLTDEDRRQLAEMRPAKRLLRRTWWLLKSLLLKLTPARRIMLAVALWVLIIGSPHIRFTASRLNVDIRMPWVASLFLLGVLMLELRDKLVARDELEAGRQVQLALLPEMNPVIPGWQAWLYTQPANDVGGDLVDHLQLNDERHFLALGDVAGKALPAALLSVKLQATLRALAPRIDALGDLGAAMNNILYRDGLPTRFASLVYLLLTTGSGDVRVLNAGHMPPLVIRGDVVTPMERGSMVLGIMPDAAFSEQRVDLSSGDTLIVFSDGVTEAMNETGDFFSDERLYEIVRKTSGMTVAAIGTAILDAVRVFIGDAVPSDDVSLMVLRRQ